jgi:2-keto-4-pentenoate hydratase/2-oxohepta-3-ene-1,7-dioic acid hydratase in catechol pathway
MQFRLGTFSMARAVSFPGLVLDGGALAYKRHQSRAMQPGDTGFSDSDRVVPLSTAESLLTGLNLKLRKPESLLALLSDWETNFQALAILCASFPDELARASVPIEELHTHAPIDPPRQIFCTIANYRSHIVETIVDNGAPPHTDGMDAEARRQYAFKVIEERLQGSPYVCFKPPSTVIGPTDALEIPRHARRVDWELELAAVVGRVTRRVSRSDAMTCIAGYTLANDITARDQVRRTDVPSMGTDWLQSKSAPGFLPLGPYLVPAAFLPDPYAVRLNLSLNDRHVQDGRVSDMLFDIATQIEYISQHVRLLPGDIICTGTPAGCGTHYNRYLQPGDVIHASAPQLGGQHTACIAEASN